MKKRLTNGWSRVTTVLSSLNCAWLEWWWRKNGFEACDKIRDASTDFGKKVHKLIEEDLAREHNCNLIAKTKEEQCAFKVTDWFYHSGNSFKPLYLEQELKDTNLKLIGHCDLIAEINGEQVVIDYKTSKKIDKSYALQLAAYAHMANKQLKTSITKGIILRVDKETQELEVVEYKPLQPFWKIFRAGLSYYKFINGK